MNQSLVDFLKVAEKDRVVPVIKEVFFSGETPLTIFEKLGSSRVDSFLLESAEHGVWSRYSFIGVASRGRLFQNMLGQLTWVSEAGHTALPKNLGRQLPDGPLEALESLQAAWFTEPSLSALPLTSGLVGFLGWDIVRELESLPQPKDSTLETPRMCFSLIRDLVVVDHQTSKLTFISNVFIEGQSRDALIADFERAQEYISSMIEKLKIPNSSYFANVIEDKNYNITTNMTSSEFNKLVESAKESIRIGDVFQVVLSQAFSGTIRANPLDVYRMLRAVNPSPYMYLMNGSDEFGAFSVVGSSPEALVTITGDHVVTHPIAGSRPRGSSSDEEMSLESSLLADPKERSEHLMLVDLARNDLSRVCEPNSVRVSEFMQIHKYSHIMHLVSTVEGKLSKDVSPIGVFRATFPAGTLSGAPKPKALEIIEDLEPTHRGLYGGVVGYFDFTGNSDLAIAIRTTFMRDGVYVVQAGAGLVLESIPESEYQETRSKASAVLKALTSADMAEEI